MPTLLPKAHTALATHITPSHRRADRNRESFSTRADESRTFRKKLRFQGEVSTRMAGAGSSAPSITVSTSSRAGTPRRSAIAGPRSSRSARACVTGSVASRMTSRGACGSAATGDHSTARGGAPDHRAHRPPLQHRVAHRATRPSDARRGARGRIDGVRHEPRSQNRRSRAGALS